MNTYLRRKLMRPLTSVEVQILRDAGETDSFNNRADELPCLESMKSFVMLCRYDGFSNADAFWKEYRLLSEMLADTSGYYIHTPIPKRNGGGYRHIYKVDEDLAFYQRNIKQYILDVIDAKYTSRYAYAYRKRISVVTNARTHAGHDYLVKMDIKDFFDSTRQSKVFEIFSKYTGYNKEVKTVLTKLVCHDGHLNQGSCTSPQLANLALADFDRTVAMYCDASGITYSRYCDDLAFSSEQEFDAKTLIGFVTDQLRKEHYRPNFKKTRVYKKGSRHIVTGIVVNNRRIRVPSEYKHNLRQELYYIKKFGITSHLEHKNPDGFGSVFASPETRHEESYLNMLIGRAEFASMVDRRDRELKQIVYELNQCLRNYDCEFDTLYKRYVNYASDICRNHILTAQDSCNFVEVGKSFWKYDGLTVRVDLKPNNSRDTYLFRYIVWLMKDHDFPALKSHHIKCIKKAHFVFTIPVYEFAQSGEIIRNCLDELLMIYSKLKLKGYLG